MKIAFRWKCQLQFLSLLNNIKVNDWLCRLKDNNEMVNFPEFVSQYSALFAAVDPGSSDNWLPLV